jgi:sterol desaturase/sphingolipid hydroxylase (fatty acid hydroxylase superfamily)
MSEFTHWVMAALQGYVNTLGIVVLACGISWFFEQLRPAVPDLGFRSRVDNLKVLMLVMLGLLLLPFLGAWILQVLPDISLIATLFPNWKRDGWLWAIVATLIYAFIWDFFQYWVHRAQHAIPSLWAFHRVHHSDTAMNASTSLRQSFGSVMLQYFFVHTPTFIVCGGGLLPYMGSMVLFSGWGYLNHANFKIPFGRMSWLLSGPQLHRLHHGKASDYHDCNYAAFFPILDFIFGTLRLPYKNEWPESGILNDTTPKNLLFQAFLPWRKN